MKVRHLFLAVLFPVVSGCSVVSGERAIAITSLDRERLEHAERRALKNVPYIHGKIDNRQVEVYKVAFDGTMNHAERVPAGESQTIVALIAKRLDAKYYPGPGMQSENHSDWIDAITGSSSSSIAEKAKEDFFVHINERIKEDPDVDIRVFVTGFSRGAAIARHFMNLVEEDWRNSEARTGTRTPHFYALLYDTVSTGQTEKLKLSIPVSVEHLVHMVALDEPRPLFTLLLDVDAENLSVVTGDSGEWLSDTTRINLVPLPGAHSDVGGTYMNGVGKRYRVLSEQILYKMGLLSQNCWESDDDPLMFGKHDSRGMLDVFLMRAGPNTSRASPRMYYPMPVARLSSAEEEGINNRLWALVSANFKRRASFSRTVRRNEDLVLKVLRESDSLRVLSHSPSQIDGASFVFSNDGAVRRLRYRFLPPYEDRESTLVFQDEIWNRIRDGEATTLNYVALQSEGKTHLQVFLDDVMVASQEATVSEGEEAIQDSYKCEHGEDGNLRSPLQIHILSR